MYREQALDKVKGMETLVFFNFLQELHSGINRHAIKDMSQIRQLFERLISNKSGGRPIVNGFDQKTVAEKDTITFKFAMISVVYAALLMLLIGILMVRTVHDLGDFFNLAIGVRVYFFISLLFFITASSARVHITYNKLLHELYRGYFIFGVKFNFKRILNKVDKVKINTKTNNCFYCVAFVSGDSSVCFKRFLFKVHAYRFCQKLASDLNLINNESKPVFNTWRVMVNIGRIGKCIITSIVFTLAILGLIFFLLQYVKI